MPLSRKRLLSALASCQVWLHIALILYTEPGGAAVSQTATKPPHQPPPPPPPVILPSVPGGRRCVFPFWWHGRWHHTCVRYNLKGEEWCSITANFTRDENWMRCDNHDVMRFHCRVPFVYGGHLHYGCLPLSMAGPSPLSAAASGHWCGLKASVGTVSWLSSDWAFCESPNATTADFLKAVGWHRGLTGARLAALLKIARHRNAVQSEAAAVGAEAVGSNHAAAAAAAAAASSGGTSADEGSSSGDDGSSRWGVGLVVSLGVACGLLTLAVAITGCAVHRRYFRGRYKRIDPLLTSDPMEKSGYGGIEAYHD